MRAWLLRLLGIQSKKQLNRESRENVEIDQILAWEMYMQEYGA